MKKSPIDNKRAYLKYTGLTAQIIAVFVVCYFIGNAIDNYFALATPIATIVLLFVGIVSFFYMLVLDLSNTNKK